MPTSTSENRPRSVGRWRALLRGGALAPAACSGDDTNSSGSSDVNAPPVSGSPTVDTSVDSTDVPLDPPSVDDTDTNTDTDTTALRLDQPLRPAVHYAPPFGWMNDPNGLSFVDGRWHLYFQYNPLAVNFGDIGWGHAVSDDLTTWETWPVAIEPAPGELIFSGSLVNDRAGTSPLCDAGQDPSCLVAVYTTHRDRPDGSVQTQDLAVSTRAGIDFTKYEGNPVIDLALADFRDPKVFWHPPTDRWIMVVVLPIDRQVVLFGSPDLVAWEELSRFGPLGAVDGIWECPDLFPLPVTDGDDSDPGEKWVMKIDHNPGHVAGGSGGQYFVGEFDGTTFVPDEPDAPEPRWVDWGTDFYCATTFHEGNDDTARPLWLGWMNNWSYATELPTFPWRGSMTAPRRMELTTGADGRLALTQRLPAEFEKRAGAAVPLDDVRAQLPPAFLLDMVLDGSGEGDAAIELVSDGMTAARIDVDTVAGTVRVDRPVEGNAGPDTFSGSTPPAPLGTGPVTVLVDRASVEVLADEGRTSITSLMLPYGAIDDVVVHGAELTLRPLT